MLELEPVFQVLKNIFVQDYTKKLALFSSRTFFQKIAKSVNFKKFWNHNFIFFLKNCLFGDPRKIKESKKWSGHTVQVKNEKRDMIRF